MSDYSIPIPPHNTSRPGTPVHLKEKSGIVSHSLHADPTPFSAVPEELRTRPQWVIWRYGPPRNGGKRPKMPYSPLSFATASVTDPSTWATFDEALAALKSKSGAFNGLGYVFSADDPFTGVDLDSCVNGEVVTPEARDLITTLLGAYVERSVSGTGIHAIVRAQLPGPGRRRGSVECYDRSRFFVVTGHALSEPGPIADAQAIISSLYADLGGTSRETSPTVTTDTSTPVSLDNGFVQWLSQHMRRLLDSQGIPFGATSQLRALLERDELPPALRAKGDSPSERRALVVRQLGRSGHMPEEIYVLALALWDRYGYASKRPKDMITDVMRLITNAHLNPATYSRYSLDRHTAYVRSRPHGNPPPVTPEPPPFAPVRPPTPHRAPCSPTAYVEVLRSLIVGGIIIAPRRERAEAAHISIKTAQRLEAQLQTEGVLRIQMFTLTHNGRCTRMSLIRLTPTGIRAKNSKAAENTPDVHTKAKDNGADVHTKNSIAKQSIRTAQTDNFALKSGVCIGVGKNTVCAATPCGGAVPVTSGELPLAATDASSELPAAAAVARDVPQLDVSSLRNLVGEALDAYGTKGGKAAFRRVVTHVRTVGESGTSEAVIERVYQAELEQRRRVRVDAALRARVEALSLGQCHALLRRLANRMAADTALASELDRQPFVRDPVTGEDTEVRRSTMTPAALRARAGMWSRQYDLVAEILDERLA